MSKIIVLILLISSPLAFSMGQRSPTPKTFKWVEPKVTDLKKSSLEIYDKKMKRLKLPISDKERDMLFKKANLHEVDSWDHLDRDYLYHHAVMYDFKELRMIYPELIPYKVRRFDELVPEL